MDELELIRAFRQNDATPNPVARVAARDGLTAHIAEAQAETQKAGSWRARRAGRDRRARRVRPSALITMKKQGRVRAIATPVCVLAGIVGLGLMGGAGYLDSSQQASTLFARETSPPENGWLAGNDWLSADPRGDRVLRADHDGDGRADGAVFRPSESNWYSLRTSDGKVMSQHFGLGGDRALPADHDGDGRAKTPTIAFTRSQYARGAQGTASIRATPGATLKLTVRLVVPREQYAVALLSSSPHQRLDLYTGHPGANVHRTTISVRRLLRYRWLDVRPLVDRGRAAGGGDGHLLRISTTKLFDELLATTPPTRYREPIP